MGQQNALFFITLRQVQLRYIRIQDRVSLPPIFFSCYEFQTFTNSVFSSWFVLEKCKKNENALNLMPMLSTIEFKDNNEDFITTFKKIVLEKI